jgi:hypothetical protein
MYIAWSSFGRSKESGTVLRLSEWYTPHTTLMRLDAMDPDWIPTVSLTKRRTSRRSSSPDPPEVGARAKARAFATAG